MFEIIMLFAFLYASTCQLLPQTPPATKPPRQKRHHLEHGIGNRLPLGRQKGQAAPESQIKMQRNNRNYAHAA